MSGSLEETIKKLKLAASVVERRKWAVELAVKMNIGQDVIHTAKELLDFVEKGEAPEPLKGADNL